MFDLIIDSEKCNGCGCCVTACSLDLESWGSKGNDGLTSNSITPPLLTIKMGEDGYHINVCRNCKRPLCAEACVAGAISVDPISGIVEIEAKKCVGCWSCVMECPFGAISLFKGKAAKCDHCLNRSMPKCALFCPTGALRAIRRDHRPRRRAAQIGKVAQRRPGRLNR